MCRFNETDLIWIIGGALLVLAGCGVVFCYCRNNREEELKARIQLGLGLRLEEELKAHIQLGLGLGLEEELKARIAAPNPRVIGPDPDGCHRTSAKQPSSTKASRTTRTGHRTVARTAALPRRMSSGHLVC